MVKKLPLQALTNVSNPGSISRIITSNSCLKFIASIRSLKFGIEIISNKNFSACPKTLISPV